MAEGQSRSLLKPVIGALVVIALIILIIAFRGQAWDATKAASRAAGDWLTNWVPNHPGQTVAIVIFAVFAFLVNWVAHVRGRLRAWIFAIVLELGLWLLFWFGAGIPPLNDLFGADVEPMTATTVLLSGIIVIAIAGVIFWWLESREEWRKYRHRLSSED